MLYVVTMVIKKWHCGCSQYTSDCIFKSIVLQLQNMGMEKTYVTITTDVLNTKEGDHLTSDCQRCVYKGLNKFMKKMGFIMID